MITEKRLWKEAKRHLAVASLERVEPSFTPGIPDLYYVGKHGNDGWIELKVVASRNCKVNMRHPQVMWIESKIMDGVNVWILVGVDAPRELHLIHGSMVRRLANGKIGSMIFHPHRMPSLAEQWEAISNAINDEVAF